MFKRLVPLLDAEGEIGAVSRESNSVEGAEVAAAQTQEEQASPAVESQADVTKQESFAKRLKESTEKALAEERTKWEQEKAATAQVARDAAIAELGYTWNGKPITTEAEYKQAKEEERLWAQYKQQELPDDVIQELVEGKRFREQYQQTQQTLEQRQRQEADFQAFVTAYPDVKADEVPQSVWDEVNKGKSLVDAYARHENQQLKQKLAEFEQRKQIEQQNADNAASSTGSVTGQGDGKPTYFTPEQVAKMSQAEANKHYEAIIESQKKWYT